MPNWTKEQNLAIKESGKNIIVSAGAGSGKTAVLSERVIEKLKSGIKINELLILTFTNAAAGEMKERIRKKINECESIKDNLDYLESSYITTFDSYTLSLVKKYNYLLNVSSNLSIVDDGIIMLKKSNILDGVFMEMYEENNQAFKKFISSFEVKDDKKIKKVILDYIKSIDLKIDRDEYLNSYIDIYYNHQRIEEYIKEYEELLQSIVNEIEENLILISNTDYYDYYSELEKALNKLITSKTYEEIKNNWNIKLPRRPRDSEDIKVYKETIDKLLKKLNGYLVYANIEEIYNTFDITKDYVVSIIEIIKRFYKYLDDYKFKNDLYEFNDISKMAIKLLKEHEDIRLELKNYYNEIEVDEYQDTNNVQEEFIKLIANNNVYMVGDIKQSIYGFRNANPSIFKEKYDNYALDNGGIKIDLLKNFRSRSEVLDGINKIFSLVMDNYLGGADYKNDHQMNYGNMMYEEKNDKQNYNLEILNYDNEAKKYQNEEIESFIIGKDILNKINNNYMVIDSDTKKLRLARYEDFCIIMDRGTSFKTYKKIFEYLGIPLCVYEDRTLTNEDDILVISNLIGLIYKIYNKEFDDEFKYDFVSVARSFLFSYNDNQIFEIIMNNKYYETDVYKLCLDIASKVDKLNIYELLKLIINKFDYYNNIIKIGNVEDVIIRIDNLLNISNNLSNIGYTLEDFKEYLEEMIASDSEIKYSVNNNSNNSVKIMNIHKSKGLEFPVCYFSGLYKTFNVEDAKKSFAYSNKYGIITPYFKDGLGNTIISSLFKKDYIINNISESIRLFYVALTRAKEKIILVTSLDKETNVVHNLVNDNIREKYNSFLSIINSIKNCLNDYIKDVNIDEYNITKDYLFNKEKINAYDNNFDQKIKYKDINIPNNTIEEEHASKTIINLLTEEEIAKMEYGSIIHKVFEETDFLNIEDDNPYKEKIVNFVNRLSITKTTKIYKECEFIYDQDDISYHGIIDLILIDDNKVKIVDYKLKDIDDNEYKKQLKVYYNYLKTIFNKDISVYLYSILNNELKEVEINEYSYI